jgi:general secretion pathway protein E
MIGEIRDAETAQIAVQASLTGHLVLATLHTNDAVSAVNRLIDMGIEPFLLASSLLGVLSQRLVRRCCPVCGGPSKAAGCTACGQTGYQGRSGVYELLEVDEGLRALIHQRASEAQLRDWALQHGMRTLRQDGERWLATGVTTLEELLRVTGDA